MAVLGLPGVAGMLVGPAAKENGGSSHCSSQGLLAYGAGSSIVIVDVRSMQLVTVLPMPSPGTTAFLPAPFVTSLRWTPEGIQRDLTQESPTAHMRLAVGDRQGRIAIWNVGSGEVTTWLNLEADKGKLGVQDLCWVYGHPWTLIAIHGASLVILWDVASGRPIWRLDAAPEVLGCISCDPFDARQVCVIGLKGLVLSIHIGSLSEMDIIIKRYQLNVVDERGNTISIAGSGKGMGGSGDRDSGKEGASVSGGGNSGPSVTGSPALVLSPGNNCRCLFSSTSRGILYIMFPREIFVFDLQFGTVLSSVTMPRGCGKLLDLVAVVDGDMLYCAHVDGKLTAWQRKEKQQVYSLCHMDNLMPSLGTSVPAPAILSVRDCSFQILVENLGSNMELGNSSPLSHLNPFAKHGLTPNMKVSSSASLNDTSVRSNDHKQASVESTFLSISDDGKIWHWSITYVTGTKERSLISNSNGWSTESRALNANGNVASSSEALEKDENDEAIRLNTSSTKLDTDLLVPTFKLVLTGQLNLLSSVITTLAVPVPSLLATSTGGGNGPAVSVPLVALASQGGTLELVDAAANTVTSSFLVHTSSVRGLRWLGNSRLVSFSYTEVKGKGGGFVNHLFVTCIRSGQSKPFRVLQKPERTPMRALRTSPSGRYLLILFRDAPAEVWAMTKNPQMLRSLALPFTVMEWALPPAPKVSSVTMQASSWRSSLFYKERPTMSSTVGASSASHSAARSAEPGPGSTGEISQDETAESFAFALVNGSLGVFELRGRRVRDFRPKWPSASFVSADVLVTAMAYRTPHVVMGDRSGNIRWWDVISGLSSTFNSHRGGVRRIKFAPVVAGDQTRGRVAALFNDYTFAIYDLNTQDPLKNAIVQSHFGGILVLELDWFPLRSEESDSMLLCAAGADSSFRLLEVNTSAGSKTMHKPQRNSVALERFRPMPLCSPGLLPLPHALALRMLLQLGVQPSWFSDHFIPAAKPSFGSEGGDLRSFLLETSLPGIGEVVVAELLLKALEPYRMAGRLLDLERAYAYASLASRSCTLRFAFAAAHFGDYEEAIFWLQLPHALALLSEGSGGPTSFWENGESGSHAPQFSRRSSPEVKSSTIDKQSVAFNGQVPSQSNSARRISATGPFLPDLILPCQLGVEQVPNDQAALCATARERMKWHEKLAGPEAIQKRVHELISLGDFEAAVTLLLSTPPDSANFYVDALRAISLASAVSPALHELAVKVVAANLVATEHSLSGTHLLCAVGCYQEACTQLQDTGRWVDAATLAAAHMQGSDYSRVLQRWADHVLHNEQNLWRAMILYVAAGALVDALAALRSAKQPDSAAMFLLACHEVKMTVSQVSEKTGQESSVSNHQSGAELLNLPGSLNNKKEEVRAVCEYFGQYQIALAHLCTGVAPAFY